MQARKLFRLRVPQSPLEIAGFRKVVSHEVVHDVCFSTDGKGVNRNYKSAYCSTMTRGLFTFRTLFLFRRRNNLQGFENKKRGGGGGTFSCQLSAFSFQEKPGGFGCWS